jgi:hypothetical protein
VDRVSLWQHTGTGTVAEWHVEPQPPGEWVEVRVVPVDEPAPEPVVSPLVTLADEQAVLAHLWASGVQAPSLNPFIGSRDHAQRWSGWNSALAIGVDAEGRNVAAELVLHADGKNPRLRVTKATANTSSATEFVPVYPLSLLTAQATINHPQWTPGNEEVTPIVQVLHEFRVAREAWRSPGETPEDDETREAWAQAHDLYDMLVAVIDCLTPRRIPVANAEDRLRRALRVLDGMARRIPR